MHGMLKRAAVSAVPALAGLAVSPASALAAPHTAQAVAGPVMSGREAHERLVQLPRSRTIRDRLAGTTGTAKTTADTYWSNGTGAGFAAIPLYPVTDAGIAQLARFYWGPGSVKNVGAPAYGIIATGRNDKTIGNHAAVTSGSGITIYRNNTGSETGATGSAGSTGSTSRNGGNIFPSGP
jgi:hypothetical protein